MLTLIPLALNLLLAGWGFWFGGRFHRLARGFRFAHLKAITVEFGKLILEGHNPHADNGGTNGHRPRFGQVDRACGDLFGLERNYLSQ